MATDELITLLEQGLESGRISPYLASYIAATELNAWPDETDFSEELELEGADGRR